MKNPHFSLYRYQILPITRELQSDFLRQDIPNLKTLLAKKNQLFINSFKAIQNYSSHEVTITHKIEAESEDITIIRFNVSRKLDRETKDFRHEAVENWPSFLVFIWNHPDGQVIGVERRFAAFHHPETVVRLIIGLINKTLSSLNLRAHWEPIFEEHIFWNLMRRHEGKIQELKFSLVTPNMANISANLGDELKDFAKHTNSAETSIELKADPDSALKVEKTNAKLRSLVEYSSQGGGDISIRIKGLRKTIRTSRSVKTIEIDQIEAANPTMAASIIRTLLDK